MPESNKFVMRVAVGSPSGPKSATLRVWTTPGKSDVYVAIREIASEAKVSLHESGECLAGLTSECAVREVETVKAMGGSRHQNRWMRQIQSGPRVVVPLQFVVPASELTSFPREALGNDVALIQPPAEGRSVIFSCMFSGQEISDEKWPGRPNGTQLLTSQLLPNGEKFWLIWQDAECSEVPGILEEARAHKQNKPFVPFSGTTNGPPPSSRHLVFKHYEDAGSLIVIDAATL